MLALALALIVFLPTLTLTVSANPPADPPVAYEHFIIYQGENGDAVCREATLAEARELDKIKPTGLTPINHLNASPKPRLGAQANPPRLTINLEGTEALNANAAAKAALERAAAQWESRIPSPVTIYLDVDYGPTNFGTAFPQGVLASTSSLIVPNISYDQVRNSLISVADTPGKLTVYNALPANSLPIDNGGGSTTSMTISGSIARAIRLLNPTAQPTDQRPRIGFNSNINYDFDRSNGTVGTDFESVAMHEIGHALGFSSRSGANTTLPGMLDLYRFRSGTTSSTFTNAQRIMTVGGPTINSQYFFFPGVTEVGLSDGGPNPPPDPPFPNNSDGNQSSHWRQQNLNAGVYIGIMDPRLPSNIQRAITQRDLDALSIFGYNSDVFTPPPANDNFASAQSISGCSGSVNGANFGATMEAGERNHLSETNNSGGTRSVWYQWVAPSNSSVTFNTIGSTFDTVLGVYTGGSVGLTNVISQDDDTGGTGTSSVTFVAAANTTYMIAVDGFDNFGAGGDTGAITLNWNVSGCSVSPQIQLMLDQSGPAADQASAVDSVLLIRDPFLVVNSANVFNNPSDPNTRVMIFQRGLLNVPASSVTVNLIDSNNQSYDIPAQDMRLVPSQDFTQIIFRLPSNLPAGTCRIKVVSQGLFSNTATFRIN